MTGFFLPVPPVRGGSTEKTWHGLAALFAAAGHSVTFVSRRWPGLAPAETAAGVTHIRLPGFGHSRSLAVNLGLDLIWGVRVARALPPADVVICNTVTLPAWLRLARRGAGKVVVMMGRSPKGQVRLYRAVSRIYAPSSFVAAQITSARASARTRVVGYPIDWGLHARSARQAGPPVTLGYVGRLHPEKGIALLVRAAGRLAARPGLPEWRLRIAGPAGVGEGGGGEGWAGPLRAQAAEALGGRVEWLAPEYDPRRLADLYGGMDVFCYPSLAERGETFGVAVAEAMAARCAPVVSSLRCFADLVTDGETGLAFDHRAADADRLLADCMGRLVADAALRAEVARRAQAHAKHFDYPEVSRMIMEDLALLTGAGGQDPAHPLHA